MKIKDQFVQKDKYNFNGGRQQESGPINSLSGPLNGIFLEASILDP